MPPIVSISDVSKTYAPGRPPALKTVNLSIECGIVTPTTGSVTAGGHDIAHDYRGARAMIGLVPQELTTDAFESVWSTVSFSRGLFGKPANPAHIAKILKD